MVSRPKPQPSLAARWRGRISRALGRSLSQEEAAALVGRQRGMWRLYESGDRPLPPELGAAMLWRLLEAEMRDKSPTAWALVCAIVGEDLVEELAAEGDTSAR